MDIADLQRFDLIVCTWLHQLYIQHCDMCELPSAIALLTDLMELDLTRNRFTSIDAIDFTRMSKLTSLKVSVRLWCCSRLVETVTFDFHSSTSINLDHRWIATGTMRHRWSNSIFPIITSLHSTICYSIAWLDLSTSTYVWTCVFAVVLGLTSITLQIGEFEGNTSSLTIANAHNLTKLSMYACARLDSIRGFHQLTTLLELEVCYS
jgi:hypothetical protein